MKEVFLSYAHDDHGPPLMRWLRSQLAERGWTAVTDEDLPKLNPASMPEWMTKVIRHYPVVAIMTDEYVSQFLDGDSPMNRRGVLYESRIIASVIYGTVGNSNCRIIPVRFWEVNPTEVPPPLSNLLWTTLDRETASGMCELTTRLSALSQLTYSDIAGPEPEPDSSDVTTKKASQKTRPVPETLMDPSELSTDLTTLGMNDAQRTQLVERCVRYIDSGEQNVSQWIYDNYTALEKAAKSTGDFTAISRLSTALKGLLGQSSTLPVQIRTSLIARTKICLDGWVLQRQNRLYEAERATKEGLHLAHTVEDRPTAIYARKCLARIYRIAGEQILEPADALRRFDISIERIEEAILEFSSSDFKPDVIGDCLELKSRAYLSRFRRSQEPRDLIAARAANSEALTQLPADTSKDYLDAMITASRLCFEEHDVAKADLILRSVLQKIDFVDSRSEILARTLFEKSVTSQNDVAQRRSELERARTIFDINGQAYNASECTWELFFLEPGDNGGIDFEGLRSLEQIEPNAMRRVVAVEIAERQLAMAIDFAPGMRPNSAGYWRHVLRQISPDLDLEDIR